jgi:hypothetical protein
MQEAYVISEARIQAKQVDNHVLCEGCRRHGVSARSVPYRAPSNRELKSRQEGIEGLPQPGCSCEARFQVMFEDLLKKKV